MSSPDFDLGADAYRRRITVEAVGGSVSSRLVDDFHDFHVTLGHDGERVVSVTCESVRWPWTTCPSAAESLAALAGMPLSRRFTAAGRWTDPKQNCTHQFDAACHAITHAAWGRTTRVYDVEVPSSDPATGSGRVRLWVDGALRYSWSVTRDGIGDPEPALASAPWRGGFMRWVDTNLPEDDAECAIVLRRACDIGLGRGMDLDRVPVASVLPNSMSGVCFTMQPETSKVAFRHVGSIRDFSAEPELLDR